MTDNHGSAAVDDILAIQRLLFRNLRAADDKDWDAQAATQADRVVIDFGGMQPPQEMTPRQLAEWSEPTYALVRTIHMQTSVEVDVDENLATSHSYGHARHERTDTGDSWHIYAAYENDFVRTDSGWRISRIKMTPIFQEGNPKLLEESAAASKSAK